MEYRRKSSNFLPDYFKSSDNKKFLSATLDQLISEPKLKKLNGYIGRAFSASYSYNNNYILEDTPERNYYQLEPSVVITLSDGTTQVITYTDLINKIKFYGGNPESVSDLFSGETYNYDGHFDFDKITNFGNYFWLPNGPEAVDVGLQFVESEKDFYLSYSKIYESYEINDEGYANNIIYLVRGGRYNFISQENIWIQSNKDLSGNLNGSSYLSSRDIYGVEENGGKIVSFRVPSGNEQNYIKEMPVSYEADFAIDVPFSSISNKLLKDIPTSSFDGIVTDVDYKYVIFVNQPEDGEYWVSDYIRDADGNVAIGYESSNFTVSDAQKLSVWQIRLVEVEGEQAVTLSPIKQIESETKVFVKSGFKYSSVNFYNNGSNSTFQLLETVTVDLDTLYFYTSPSSSFGIIRIIDPLQYSFSVESDIIRKTGYITPNRVKFSNGMKIRFDDSVLEEEYRNKVFYVEGVGSSIRLISAEDMLPVELFSNSEVVDRGINYSVGDILHVDGGIAENEEQTLIRVNGVDESGGVTDFSIISCALYSELPENPVAVVGGSGSNASFDLFLQANLPDYITIKRSSEDYNSWSRANRWFHEDIIRDTAMYNGKPPVFDQQARGNRPIIEFDSNLKLFDSGKFFSEYVDVADFSYQDALSNFHGSADVLAMNSTFVTGTKVIFMGDNDPDVRNKIFTSFVQTIDEETKIFLQEYKTIENHECVIVLSGINAQKSFYFENGEWKESQIKTDNNRFPLFDIVDKNGISFGNQDIYPLSSFSGNKIFSYKSGSTYDPVLRFRISYRNIGNIGDIEFSNTFENESFSYSTGSSSITEMTSSGYLVKYSRDNDVLVNVWKTLPKKPEQYQQYSSVLESGQVQFMIPSALKNDDIVVHLNSVVIPRSRLIIEPIGNSTKITLVSTVTNDDDRLDIFFNPVTPNPNVFFDIPTSLQNNPMNQTLTDFTMGQLRGHVKKILSQSKDLIGIDFGSNNSRDLYYKDLIGEILQHSSPAIYSFMFLVNDKLKFVESIQNASKEYSRFKTRFLESAKKYDSSSFASDSDAVDSILSAMTVGKSIDSPWFYSDMVPYGGNKKKNIYKVLNIDIRKYKIDEIYDPLLLSNKAILVYLNGKQLLKDKDYIFSESTPSIELLPSVALKLNDEIQVVTYVTDGNFIPETPTKLGLYPSFEPVIEIDDTYTTPTSVIIGHDGSITPSFGDHRDEYLLELERRIFNNIKTEFNYGKNSVLLNSRGGKFRKTSSESHSLDTLLAGSFLKWVGQNQLSFSENTTFSGNNPRTWNHKNSQVTIDNSIISGNWRSVYQKYFDTDKPHTKPWEMLGFSIKPDWWEKYYGPAPYTGGNKILWSDLENGVIRDGDRKGVDERFRREGLSKIIPVDDFGNLKMPNEFMIKSSNYNTMSSSWSVGDCGPVETAWKNSSDYPYAVQIALSLLNPGEYFSLLIDTSRYSQNTIIDQFSNKTTNKKLSPNDVVINGLSENGSISRSSSWINWVVDNLTAQGISGAKYVSDVIKSANVQLSYRVAGFTDKSLVSVYADQTSPTSFNESVLVPTENYQFLLHKSSPIQRVVYSAVIVRKTPSGYAIEGYDYKNPFFTIIPSRSNNNHYVIKSGSKSAKIYNDYQRTILVVPYGYEFRTRQQVVDFLVSYQRYLLSSGFVFDEFNEELRQRKDWVLSAREFMTWSNQGWKDNSMIVLSPASDKIVIETGSYTADEITGKWNESKILDLNFSVISPEKYSIYRDDGIVEIETINQQSIALADISLIQYEHLLLMDNETVFSDVIYQPIVGSRQLRLKLVGKKTDDWYGNVNPPGFMYFDGNIPEWSDKKDYFRGDVVKWKEKIYSAKEFIPTSSEFNFEKWKLNDSAVVEKILLRNFASNASKFTDIYDVDGDFYEKDLEKFSSSLIGFRTRSYLNDFGVDAQTQLKFYQGFIKDKGTKSAIDSLTKTKFNKLTGDIDFNEEWAIRVGEFGHLGNKDTTEIIVTDNHKDTNPIVISLVESEDQKENYGRNVLVSELYSSTTNSSNIFQTTPLYFTDSNILTGGFVNDDDVDISVLSFADSLDYIKQQLVDIGDGYTISVAKSKNNDWDVFRVTTSSLKLNSVEYGLDGTAVFTLDSFHDFSNGEYFIVKNFSKEIDGVYQVLESTGLKSFSAVVSSEITTYLEESERVEGYGFILRFKSVKYSSSYEYDSDIPWKTGNKLWINSLDERWSVYEKNTPYSVQYAGESTEYGISNKILHTDDHIFLAYKDYGDGVIIAINRKTNARNVISCPLDGCVGFGKEIYIKDNKLYASAEDSATYGGVVILFDTTEDFSVVQYILSDNVANFGNSICHNTITDQVLLSSPVENKIHVFKYFDTEYKELALSTTAGIFTYLLPLFPESPTSVRITGNDGVLLISPYDYTIQNQEITFTNDPGTQTYVVEEYGYYTKTSTIVLPAGYDSASFGSSLVCPENKSQVFVGAPLSTVNGVDCGSVYMFDQIIESYIYDGGSIDTNREISENSSGKDTNTIIANGKVLRQYVDYTVVDGNVVIISPDVKIGDIVSIYINEWSLTQQLIPDTIESGMKYGHAIAVCSSGCTLVISAPGYQTVDHKRGLVVKYDNTTRLSGKSVSSNKSPVINPSDSLIINGFEVFADGQTISTLSDSINLANIPGISSSVVLGDLVITSESLIEFDALTVSNGYGQLVEELGIETFQVTQEIKKPFERGLEYFGSAVEIDAEGKKLFISSKTPYVGVEQWWDNSTTNWDNDSTDWVEVVEFSGTIYNYEIIEKNASYSQKFYFVQEIVPQGLQSNNYYAINCNYYNGALTVLSDNSENEFFIFTDNNKDGFDLVRSSEDIVDSSLVYGISLYDRKNNNIVAFLDTIDYINSKVLGIADQHIDYKSEIDPAWYNNGTDYDTNAWFENKIGSIWWDISKVRFKDSNQSDLRYRVSKNSEKIIGSSIDVYEWIESDYLPSQFIDRDGDGVPFDITDSNFSVREYYDINTGKPRFKYYYWVKNRVEEIKGKKVSVTYLKNVIENPKGQSVPYAVVFDSNSIGLYNCNHLLNDDTTVLRIVTKKDHTDKTLHHEWHLMKESGNENIPTDFINKLIDSLVGYDKMERIVPDPSLVGENRLGISLRPRQTMFAKREYAVKTFIESLNSKLKNIPLANIMSLEPLVVMQPTPNESEYDLEFDTIDQALLNDFSFLDDGTKVLITNDKNFNGNWSVYVIENNQMMLDYTQDFNLTNYWSYTDWNSPDVVHPLMVRHTVASMSELQREYIGEGEIVRIEDTGQGNYGIYKKENSLLIPLVLENSTIKISDIFYLNTQDENYPHQELRLLLEALYNKLLINQLKYVFVEIVFLLLRYVYVEQKEPDWIMKTSFASVLHRIRKLDPYPIYVRDNQDYYLSFINEVKPYKTKIRQYLLSYNGEETLPVECTDFDKPVYFDEILAKYRVLDETNSADTEILKTIPWKYWYENNTLSIKSVEIIDSDFYSYEPTVIVRNGDGSARLRAILGEDARIKEFLIINEGGGFTEEADIYISGDSTITKVRAQLYHKNVRTISSTIKFDRTDYYGEFSVWKPNFLYKTNQYFSINERIFVVETDHLSGNTFEINEYIREIDVSEYPSAMHRAKKYYNSSSGSKNSDLKELFNGIDYAGVKVKGTLFSDPDIQFYDFERYGAPDENISRIDSYIKNTRFIDTNFGLSPSDITVDGGKFYDKFSGYGPEELIAGAIYDTLDIRVFTKIQSGENAGKHYGYRIFHDMNQNLPYHNRDAEPTVQLREDFKQTDTSIKVKLHDEFALMGTYELNGLPVPQEIMINGEKLSYTVYDRENDTLTGISRNIDGRLDSIENVVHKKDSFVTSLNNMRKSRKYFRISEENTGNLLRPLNLGDDLIHVDDANKFIKPSAPDNRPGVIYINGEKIKYFRVNYDTSTLGQITRGVDGTSIKFIHENGSRVTDMSEKQEIEGGDETLWIDFTKDTSSGTVGLFELSEKYQPVFVRGKFSYDPTL